MNPTAPEPSLPIAPILMIGLVLWGLLWSISTHNRFARLEAMIRESWSNVDVALKRRHDLLPNLVSVVQGYATHERELFERLAAAREEAMRHLGQVSEVKRSENELSFRLGQVLARVEAYPELRASEHFLQLQRELVNTEDRIAAARRFYNANVREFNTALESFPSSLLASDRRPAEFFELDRASEAERPSVAVS